MMTMTRETHDELVELIEDTLEYFCDNNMISGELSWLVVETLATSKILQLRGEL